MAARCLIPDAVEELLLSLPECAKHGDAADGETQDRPESGNHHDVSGQMTYVCVERGNGEDKSYHIEPQGSMNGGTDVSAQPKFEQKGAKSDGSHHDQRQWAHKRAMARIDDDQRQGEQKQAGSHQAPAAGLGRRRRVETSVAQRGS